jgi:hypothetical protein
MRRRRQNRIETGRVAKIWEKCKKQYTVSVKIVRKHTKVEEKFQPLESLGSKGVG